MVKLVLVIVFLSLSQADDDFFNYPESSDDLDQQDQQYQDAETEMPISTTPMIPISTTPMKLPPVFFLNQTSGSSVKRNQSTMHEKKSGKNWSVIIRFPVVVERMCVRYVLHCSNCNIYRQIPKYGSVKIRKVSLILHGIICNKDHCKFLNKWTFDQRTVCGSPKCSARQCRVEIIEQICCGKLKSLVDYLLK